MTNVDRHTLVSQFRRAVYARYGFVPFPHQAEWQLAGDGWTLTDLLATPGSPSVQVQLLDKRVVRRTVVPRVGGAARILADLAAYKTGKALTLDTPIPTPEGWSMMADLYPGHRVLAPDGSVTLVTAITPTHADPSGTYRVTFDDGTVVDCAGRHEWPVYALNNRTRHPGKWAARETVKLAQAGCRNRHGQHTFAVPVSEAWDLPPQPLPIDPYMLGVWLGDGTTVRGDVTSADAEVIAECEAAGFAFVKVRNTKYGWRSRTLHLALRAHGLLKHKHVPSAYLRASRQQRLALLQGLMDTDGSCCKRRGRVEFMNTNRHLADAVFELAVSLGMKPRLATKRATLRGQDYGEAYRVSWTCAVPVFRLARKRRLQPLSTGGRVAFRFITSIERVADQPVKCITVAHPSHQFLAGRTATPTCNSYSMGAHATGYAAIPDARVEFVGLEYGTSEPEFSYLVEFLCSEKGMNMKYSSYQNDKRGGRMRLKLTTGASFEVRSWTQKEALKGSRIDAYYYTECYQLPGIECYTTVKQNLRQRDGVAVFGTTPDRPWVAILHDMGHGRESLWHCTCGVHGRNNPHTYDAHSESLDDPAQGGLMTRERYAIAWEGKLGSYVGSVFDYQRGQLQFTPGTHPDLFDWRMLVADGLASADPRSARA